jgi:hypothetical protein
MKYITILLLFACNQPVKQPIIVQKADSFEQNYYQSGEVHFVKFIPAKIIKTKKHKQAKPFIVDIFQLTDTILFPDSVIFKSFEISNNYHDGSFIRESWAHPSSSDTSGYYSITFNGELCFGAELANDTTRVAPSLFDSAAIRAKVIIVAGKIFELKQWSHPIQYP